MLNSNYASAQVHQAEEMQVKVDHLQTENRQLLLELITLYSKYASVLQENASLKSRTAKSESSASPTESD